MFPLEGVGAVIGGGGAGARRYRLVKALGRGAFGEVLLAREEEREEDDEADDGSSTAAAAGSEAGEPAAAAAGPAAAGDRGAAGSGGDDDAGAAAAAGPSLPPQLPQPPPRPPPPPSLFAVKQLCLREVGGPLPAPVAREVAALHALRGARHVVALRDVVLAGPCAFLVQELCATDLAAVLAAASSPLPPAAVRSVMRGLLRALAEVHGRGFVHRDVSPCNVLVAPDGGVRLGDFGLARRHWRGGRAGGGCDGDDGGGGGVEEEGGDEQAEQVLSGATAAPATPAQRHLEALLAGAPTSPRPPHHHHHEQQQQQQQQQQHDDDGPVLPPPLTAGAGTRWYRAPELLYGARDYGPAADVFAAGLVFAEALRLAPLAPGRSDIDQLARLQQALGSIELAAWPEAAALPDWGKLCFARSPGRAMGELLPDAPPLARDLAARLLRYRPQDRPTAAEALRHAYFAAAAAGSSNGPAAADDDDDDDDDDAAGRAAVVAAVREALRQQAAHARLAPATVAIGAAADIGWAQGGLGGSSSDGDSDSDAG